MKRALIAIVVMASALIALSPMLVYWWGLSNLETYPVPSNTVLSAEQEIEIWTSAKEQGSPRLERFSPYSYLGFLTCSRGEDCRSEYSGIHISAQAIRDQVSTQLKNRSNTAWQFTWAAYTIWVTNNWNVHQVLSTYHESRVRRLSK